MSAPRLTCPGCGTITDRFAFCGRCIPTMNQVGVATETPSLETIDPQLARTARVVWSEQAAIADELNERHTSRPMFPDRPMSGREYRRLRLRNEQSDDDDEWWNDDSKCLPE